MKKILIYITVGLLAIVPSSCSDYLDKEVDLTLSEEQIFSKYENTRGFLANVYTYLPDAFAGYSDGQFLAASRDCMTDNSLSFWNVHYYHSVLTDAYSATNHPFAERFWSNDFKGIRAANQFMKNSRESVIGNAEKTGDDNHLYDRNIAEARLLRAIFHFDLAGWFGDIPVIGNDENGVPIVFEPGNASAMNMDGIVAIDKNDVNLSNANMSSHTPAGQMMTFASEVTKNYTYRYLLPKKFAVAHQLGDIHIHVSVLIMINSLLIAGHGSKMFPSIIIY